MSLRSLIEINHDFTHRLERDEFVEALTRYLCSGSRQNAEDLERFGLKVIGMRHHSGSFYLDGEPDGFPAVSVPRREVKP